MKNMKNRETQIEKGIFCFALMLLLQGCGYDNSLIKENPIIRACLQNKNHFHERGFVPVEKPFIIIKKNRDNDEWEIMHYSEKEKIDIASNFKTVVLVKDLRSSIEYGYGRGGIVKARVHEAEFTYFDVTKREYEKQIIHLSPNSIKGGGDYYISGQDIMKTVNSKCDYSERWWLK